MSNFDILFIGHLIGDFLFQTEWMAVNKEKKWLALILHSCIYTFSIVVVAAALMKMLTYLSISIIFLSHIFLDRRTFVNWWASTVMHIEKENGWLKIVIDQIFHLLILVLVIFLGEK